MISDHPKVLHHTYGPVIFMKATWKLPVTYLPQRSLRTSIKSCMSEPVHNGSEDLLEYSSFLYFFLHFLFQYLPLLTDHILLQLILKQ